MKKIKYYYNPNTLRYEKLETPLRVRVLRIFGFIAAAFVTAVFISFIAFKFVGSPNEKLLGMENERLKDRYSELNDAAKDLEKRMKELENRDNNVYRSIFEANPIPDSARAKALEEQLERETILNMNDRQLVNSIVTTLNNLSSRVKVQNTSYNEIDKLVSNKEILLSHTPAIQPVSNKELTRLASGFGHRVDP